VAPPAGQAVRRARDRAGRLAHGARPVTGPLRPTRFRAAVVGGGVTGLTAAHRLHRLLAGSGSAPDVVLLESAARLGGTIRTEQVDGFVIEGGPDTLLTHKPGGVELCRELGLEDDLLAVPSRRGALEILHRGRLVKVPEGFMMMAPTRLWPALLSPLFSLGGKARMGVERFLRPRPDPAGDESLSSFVQRRFGREVLERVAEPVIAGLFTADADRLSLRAVMPQFLEMERRHGSVARGLALARGNGRRAPGPHGHFAYPRGGFEKIARELARRLPPGCARAAARVEGLGHSAATGRWTLRVEGSPAIEADAVVLTCPAHASAPWLRTFDPRLASLLEGLDYASCATVNLAYRGADVGRPLESFGFFVPRVEGRPLLACSFASVKFEGRAPRGTVLLRAFLGGATRPAILHRDDDALARLAHDELASLLGIRAEPLVRRVYRFPGAMPQYEVGWPGRLDAIRDCLEQHPGLYLAGSADGALGLPDCVRSAERAARAAADHLGSALEPRHLAVR
jgi:oxygen-dependent protoporphyrinogen oxidase